MGGQSLFTASRPCANIEGIRRLADDNSQRVISAGLAECPQAPQVLGRQLRILFRLAQVQVTALVAPIPALGGGAGPEGAQQQRIDHTAQNLIRRARGNRHVGSNAGRARAPSPCDVVRHRRSLR